MAHSSMRMLVYLSYLFTCQLRDLSRIFPRRTPPPPQITMGFFLELKQILITAISENSSFLAKSLNSWQVGVSATLLMSPPSLAKSKQKAADCSSAIGDEGETRIWGYRHHRYESTTTGYQFTPYGFFWLPIALEPSFKMATYLEDPHVQLLPVFR